jgi:hypothetical protein
VPVTVVAAPLLTASITITPASGAPGTAFTVEGTGFGADEPVQVMFGSTTVGTVTAGADGRFSYQGTVATDAALGEQSVGAVSESAGAREAPFTVIAAPVPTSVATATPSPSGGAGDGEGCGCTGTPTPTYSSGDDEGCGCSEAPKPTPTESTPEEEWCGCTPAPSPSESEAAPRPESGGPGRGLAIQTAVDAHPRDAGTPAALALWSAATGLLGLGCAAGLVAFFRRTRRES